METLAELFGNVLLFVPFGFLLPLWSRRFALMAGAVGAGSSLFIELYQLAWSGVRKASANDLLMNALGALVGFTTLRLTGYRRWLAAPRLKLQIYRPPAHGAGLRDADLGKVSDPTGWGRS